MKTEQEIINEWLGILKDNNIVTTYQDLADKIANAEYNNIEDIDENDLAERIIHSNKIEYIGRAERTGESLFAHKEARLICEECEFGEHRCEGFVYNRKCTCDCSEWEAEKEKVGNTKMSY